MEVPADEEPAEDLEVAPVRLQRQPLLPSAAEVAEHEASGHAQYRSWCTHCVAAWGIANPHRRQDHSSDELPTVCSDFFFLGEDNADAMPFLCVVDRRTSTVGAFALPNRKSTTSYNVRVMGKFLSTLGYQRIVNKSDGEPAMIALKALAAKHAQVEAVPQESPADDHRANGEVEKEIQEVKRRMRACKSNLEEKLGMHVAQDDPILTWLPQYVSSQMSRFRVGSDGKTADQRRTGKTWRKQGIVFGEQILLKPVGSRKRKNDLAAKMISGRYVGHHNRHGSVMALTPNGVVLGSAFHKLPDGRGAGQAWEKAGWEALRGLPWDVNPRARRAPQSVQEAEAAGPAAAPGTPAGAPATPAAAPGTPAAPVPQAPLGPLGPGAPGEVQVHEVQPKTFRVTRKMWLEHGSTHGCNGCSSLAMFSRILRQPNHFDAQRSILSSFHPSYSSLRPVKMVVKRPALTSIFHLRYSSCVNTVVGSMSKANCMCSCSASRSCPCCSCPGAAAYGTKGIDALFPCPCQGAAI